jgi:16S rRNA C1402 N4-methylase RsmH
MPCSLSLLDAERRLSYTIQETNILTDVITEIESNISAPDGVFTLTHEVQGLLTAVNGKLCALLASINAARLQTAAAGRLAV